MQLSKFTDLGLRVLILLSPNSQESITIAILADTLKVSKNHLMKIVHFMSKKKWIITVRGKNGGIYLSYEASEYRIGDIVRELEEINGNSIINCQQLDCVLLPVCKLPCILYEGVNAFYDSLNQYYLSDINIKFLDFNIKNRGF